MEFNIEFDNTRKQIVANIIGDVMERNPEMLHHALEYLLKQEQEWRELIREIFGNMTLEERVIFRCLITYTYAADQPAEIVETPAEVEPEYEECFQRQI